MSSGFGQIPTNLLTFIYNFLRDEMHVNEKLNHNNAAFICLCNYVLKANFVEIPKTILMTVYYHSESEASQWWNSEILDHSSLMEDHTIFHLMVIQWIGLLLSGTKKVLYTLWHSFFFPVHICNPHMDLALWGHVCEKVEPVGLLWWGMYGENQGE